MSKDKNINSSIIYYKLMITLDVSSIGTHTQLIAFVTYCSIIRLYCLQPKVLGIILTQRYVTYKRVTMGWMHLSMHVV
jgi:hypothetical protein